MSYSIPGIAEMDLSRLLKMEDPIKTVPPYDQWSDMLFTTSAFMDLELFLLVIVSSSIINFSMP